MITPLAMMIDDHGMLINVPGVAYEGKGILAHDDKEYPAGIAPNGEIYAHSISIKDGVEVIETNSGYLDPQTWNFNSNYKHLLSPKAA